MHSVGQKLREARVRLGKTLEDVSAETRISLKHLRAIETDQVEAFDSAFFYKSFVRQFASSVQCNPAGLLDAIQTAASSIPEPLVPGQTGAPTRPDLPSLKPERVHKIRWALSFGALVAMMLACSSLYGTWQNARAASAEPSHAPLPKPVANKPAAPATEPKHAISAADFQIQLAAVESTWLSVSADGHEVYQGVLKPEETKTLEGHDTARIRTGNAGGVDVSFNGRDLGPLGRKGEVRTVLFSKDGYEILEPRAQAESPEPVNNHE